MKKSLLLIVVMLLSMVAYTQTIEVDGINYRMIPKANAAEVFNLAYEITGDLVIPEVINNNGKEYRVTSIADNAFADYGGLTSLTIPPSIVSIGEGLFEGIDDVPTTIYISDLTAWCNINFNGSFSSPFHLYLDGEEIRDLVIPDGVTSINDAFLYCSYLNSVTIPSSVNFINDSFGRSNNLTSVHISDLTAWCNIDFQFNPLSIAHHLYLNGTELHDLVIPNNVTAINNNAFNGASELNSITIPNSVVSIGQYAFKDCSSLKSISIPNSVTTSIGKRLFYGCTNLESVEIGSSVPSIETEAFRGCINLKTVIIGNLVASIGKDAFRDCNNLVTLRIGDAVTSIGESAFYGCSSLLSLSLPSNVKTIGDKAFALCSGITSLSMGNKVYTIGSSAFLGCSGFTLLNIGSGVKTIKNNAFAGCGGLKTIIIPQGVTNIGSNAFGDCINLTKVYCYADNIPTTDYDAFDDSYIEYATLYVPGTSINAYKSTVPWKSFGTIVAIEGTEPEMPQCAVPVINYENGQLMLSCDIEGAEFVTEITDEDVKKHYDATITLSKAYSISVYATKAGYDNSDIVTATLCWIEAEPSNVGITTGINEIPSHAVLIQNNGGILSINGAIEGKIISVYNLSGQLLGTATATSETTTISTSLNGGDTCIVKIGDQSVKILLR